jgi:hypothetical protein
LLEHDAVKRAHLIALTVVGVGALAIAESYFGSTRYELNGSTYRVPHKYEFMRNFSLPWLDGVKGLEPEPDESVWLLFPAAEISGDIREYSRFFRGYAGNYEADIVVNVLGGKEAREFPTDRQSDVEKVGRELSGGALRQRDDTTGWDRVYWLVGEKGTAGEGGSLFYLIPRQGIEHLPPHWRTPYCQGSQDIEGKETYDCKFTIHSGGLTYSFSLRQENLSIAPRIPPYTLGRLRRWK